MDADQAPFPSDTPNREDRETPGRPEDARRRLEPAALPNQPSGPAFRMEPSPALTFSTGNTAMSEEPANVAPRPLRAAASEPVPPESATPTTPVRDLSLRLEGDRQVEVRFTERAGKVEVAVKTADADLAGSLRQDLGELSSRLDSAGYRAESWQPERSSANPPSDTEDHPRQRDEQPAQQQHRHGRPPRRQQDSQQGPESRDRKDFKWLMS
jgi:hypothetical protein